MAGSGALIFAPCTRYRQWISGYADGRKWVPCPVPRRKSPCPRFHCWIGSHAAFRLFRAAYGGHDAVVSGMGDEWPFRPPLQGVRQGRLTIKNRPIDGLCKSRVNLPNSPILGKGGGLVASPGEIPAASRSGSSLARHAREVTPKLPRSRPGGRAPKVVRQAFEAVPRPICECELCRYHNPGPHPKKAQE